MRLPVDTNSTTDVHFVADTGRHITKLGGFALHPTELQHVLWGGCVEKSDKKLRDLILVDDSPDNTVEQPDDTVFDQSL